MRTALSSQHTCILHRVLAVALLTLVSSAFSLLNAQALSGIQGTVIDATGSVVPNAKVTATNTATQVASHTVTSSSGTYTITDLIPGSYNIQVEAPGFQTSVHNGVLVEVGRQSSVDVS